jgi:hypothetical protein
MKFSKALAIKSSPQVGHTNLSSFEEPYISAIFVGENVVEAGKVFCKQIDQSSS